MSETTRNKTVTFSGEASFAVVRALRQRLETLAARFNALEFEGNAHANEVRGYLRDQMAGVNAALTAMGSAQ